MANAQFTRVTAHKRHFDVYRRLLALSRPYTLHIGAFVLLSLLSTPLALLTPLPLKIAVDTLVNSQPLPGALAVLLPDWMERSDAAMLLAVTGLVILIAMLTQVQDVATTILRTYTSEKLLLDFRTRLFRHVQRLSLQFHDSRGSADSMYRVQHDTSAVSSIAIDTLIPFFTASITLVTMIYVTVRLDWQIALVALAICPPLALVSGAYRPHLRNRSREVKKLESSALGVIQEVLGAVRVVKAFGQEEREKQRFRNRSAEGMRARLHLAVLEGGFGLAATILLATGTAAALYLGVLHVRSGTLTLGNLLLVMGYIAQLYSPLKTMSKRSASLQSRLVSAERAFALLDEAPDVREHPNARALRRASGHIEFRNVSFAYDGRQAVLERVSFDVRPGTRVGIVGPTGAGKTTLLSLLMRFYDPTEGQILLDGVDLREYQVADLRGQFAMMLQEPVLFSTSLAENIAYARPQATDEQIVEAARAANAHDFITSLPEGYETLVGERGMRLSGGERQRISLARAFLRDAPILILDEPTSSVDTQTEAAIMDAFERLGRGRTTFMIAHRLSTLKTCDVLLHVERGRLADITGPGGVSDGEGVVSGATHGPSR
jgi:ATP-binding cassette subfamily B protein